MKRRVFLVRLGRLGGLGGLGLLLPVAACRKKREASKRGGDRVESSPALEPPEPTLLGATPALPQWARGLSVLSPAGALCAEAMLERLLPSNVPPGSPGAREARVLLHLDRVLATRAYKGYARLVRDGLVRLDREAKKTHGALFARLAAAPQEAILSAWQQRPHRPGAYPAARFFSLVFTFGLEGFLGDPKYGGNFEKVAWKWIDFAPGCPTPSGHCGPRGPGSSP